MQNADLPTETIYSEVSDKHNKRDCIPPVRPYPGKSNNSQEK